MMTPEQHAEILATLSTIDEAGRHFTQRHSSEVLSELEAAGLIVIHRPIHEATGIPYSMENWSVEITDYACDLVEAHPVTR